MAKSDLRASASDFSLRLDQWSGKKQSMSACRCRAPSIIPAPLSPDHVRVRPSFIAILSDINSRGHFVSHNRLDSSSLESAQYLPRPSRATARLGKSGSHSCNASDDNDGDSIAHSRYGNQAGDPADPAPVTLTRAMVDPTERTAPLIYRLSP